LIHPIKTIPVYKPYIWGGRTLEDKYGKPIPDHFAAESWEISCHACRDVCPFCFGSQNGRING
jgi:mannose-6-phosphate isomerase class I